MKKKMIFQNKNKLTKNASKPEETPFNPEKKTSPELVKRLITLSIAFQVTGFILILLFTKAFFYSIIFFLGTLISIIGFFVMIKMIDRVLQRGKGQLVFFLVVMLKLALIGLVVYLVSKSSHAETSVLFLLLGLSTIVGAIFIEGAFRIFRSVVNG